MTSNEETTMLDEVAAEADAGPSIPPVSTYDPDEDEAPPQAEDKNKQGISDAEVRSVLKGQPDGTPSWLANHLMRVSGKLYLPVSARVVWFRQVHPTASVIPEIVAGSFSDGWVVVRATVCIDGNVVAVATKTETLKSFPDGFIEKAETGAVGRALAFLGFGSTLAADLMDNDDHVADAPVARGGRRQTRGGSRDSGKLPQGTVWEGEGQCPRCHAPQGKKHLKPCV